MSDKYNFLDWLSLVLVIIGGLNWGIIGFFDYNVVGAIFGGASIITRIIYAVVGLAGLYMVATGVKMAEQERFHHYGGVSHHTA